MDVELDLGCSLCGEAEIALVKGFGSPALAR